MLRVGGFDYLDLNSTDGLALAVYFQGCKHNCRGCHNTGLQPFTGGERWEVADLTKHLLEKSNNYDYVVLLGGEPLQQNSEDISSLVIRLVSAGVKVWLYTGYEYDKVPKLFKEICYCIKTGRYDTSFPKVGKLATGNQRYYFKDGRVEK